VPPPGPGPGPAEPTDIEPFYGDGPGKLVRITQAHNANPSAAVRNAYNLSATDANVGRVLVAMAATGYNLLFYSRKRKSTDYGAARVTLANGSQQYYDIGPAWDPWNDRVLQAAQSGTKLLRRINWNGTHAVPTSERAYGSPWMPVMQNLNGILVRANADPWAPANNPPAEVLAALGWTLDAMKTAWLAGNP
jgi:hypothetical protein